MNVPKLLKPQEVSQVLGVTENTLAVWRSTQRYPLRFVKVGRSVMYRTDDLAHFIDERTRNAGSTNPAGVGA